VSSLPQICNCSKFEQRRLSEADKIVWNLPKEFQNFFNHTVKLTTCKFRNVISSYQSVHIVIQKASIRSSYKAYL